MNVFKLVNLGLMARKAFRNWRQRRRNLKLAGEVQPMLQGKLTYTSLGVLALTLVAQWLGVDLVEADALAVVQGVAVLVGVYGRWRATRGK